MFESWEFYRSRPSAGNKQIFHIVSFSAGRTGLRPSAVHSWAHGAAILTRTLSYHYDDTDSVAQFLSKCMEKLMSYEN